MILKPTVHQDTWFLRISQPPTEAPINTPPTVRWERRKKPANSPNPPRAGVTQAYHKGRGIMFGGVHDVEESEEGIESEFFDQLFALNLERNRFFPLNLRRARTVSKRKQGEERGARRGRGRADEVELLRNLAALESQGTIGDLQPMDMDPKSEEEDLPMKSVKPVLETMPHRRFNAQLAVQGDVVYIFGGTYEQGDREYTFDEMFAIDLGKLDGVQEIFRKDVENWQGDTAESDSDSNEEDESEDDDVEEDGVSGVSLPESATPSTAPTAATSMDDPMDTEEPAASQFADTRPYPRPFESLRDFFMRTTNPWQGIILESLQGKDITSNQSIKELRKIAFDTAEARWWDCREEVMAEEERQEEAGIGEVVSIANRSDESGTLGRRR